MNVRSRYSYAGTARVAMRTGGSTINYLLGDHLGSQAIPTNTSGARTGEIRYYAWGTERYTWGTTPTTFHYTGQRLESYINLYWYGSRWFDPALGRFISPDPIVPGTGEGGNQNALGYLGASTYSPLIVDYHENQLLYQLNSENIASLQGHNLNPPVIPTNSVAFDRYAYSFNNPIRYTDPTGHCPFCVTIALTLGAVTPFGWVVIGVATVATVAFVATGGPEALGEALYQVGETASDGLNALFSRKAERKFIDYLQDKYGLSPEQREELHRAISKKHYSNEEIEDIAAEIAELGQDNKDQEQGNDEDD